VSFVGTCYEGCARPGTCTEPRVQCAQANRTSFPHFAKRCTAVADCDIADHQINCCGSQAAIGINGSERNRFDAAEMRCRGQYPMCRCPAEPTVAEDGQAAGPGTAIQVQCINSFCMTFVR